mgnify:CR=1 FL=1
MLPVGVIYSQLQQAIKCRTETRRSIAEATSIDEARLSKMMNGRAGLSVEAVEQLCEYLDLEIVIRPRRTARRGKAKAR